MFLRTVKASDNLSTSYKNSSDMYREPRICRCSCSENCKGGHQNQNNLSRNPLKKFCPETPDKFVDKEEITATAKKAIVEPKLKAAHLKSKAFNKETVTDH